MAYLNRAMRDETHTGRSLSRIRYRHAIFSGLRWRLCGRDRLHRCLPFFTFCDCLFFKPPTKRQRSQGRASFNLKPKHMNHVVKTWVAVTLVASATGCATVERSTALPIEHLDNVELDGSVPSLTVTAQ